MDLLEKRGKLAANYVRLSRPNNVVGSQKEFIVFDYSHFVFVFIMEGSRNLATWAGDPARALIVPPVVPVTGVMSAGGLAWAMWRHFPFSAGEVRTLVELTLKLAAVGAGGRVFLALLILLCSAPFVFWLRDRQTAIAREVVDLASDWALQMVGVLVLGPGWVLSWRAINHLYFNDFPSAWWCMMLLVPVHFGGNLALWVLPPPPPAAEPGVMDLVMQIYSLLH